ncbi:MAG: FHA domain-containing protein, partial [Isosphaeraceae bacterium]
MTRTFELHIQSRAAPTVRVVALTGLSVRIGRGPQCEVRLDGPTLAEVHCLLRRRGETWHIQPVGPPGVLAIEGRLVDAQRPLPLGLPLRVGEHRLTLRPSGTEVASFEPSDPPILIQPAVPNDPGPSPTSPSLFVGRAYTDPTATLGSWTAGSGIDAERARPRTWGAQVEQREHWLKTRQAERRWEARWRAAGESLRSQSAIGPGQPAPPSVDRVSITRPTTRPGRPDEPAADTSGSAPATVPEVPTQVEPNRSEPPTVDPEVSHFRAAWEGDPEPDFDVAISEPATAPKTPPANRPPGTELARIDPRPTAATPTPTVEPEPAPGRSAKAEPPRNQARAKRAATPGTKAPRPKLGSVRTVDLEPPTIAPEVSQTEATGTQGDQGFAPPATWPGAEPGPGFSTVAEPPPFFDIAEPTDSPTKTFNTPKTPFRTPRPLPNEPTPFEATEEGATAPWPAATRILQGVRPRPEGRTTPRRQAKRAAARPLPTVGRAPEQWTLPLWLVWLPATLVTLAVGGFGVSLAWTWGQDDRTAGLIADRVLEHETLPDGPVLGDNPTVPAEPTWWRSTADHLSLQALVSARDAADPDAEERVEFLLHTARHASPLNREVRYARARRATSARGEPQPDAAIVSLGLSRDVIALAWTARQLLDAGKTDAALEVDRQAIALAATTAPNGAQILTFDPQTRRFLLPGEARVARVVADLAEHDGWSFAQWSSTLGGSPVATLAAYRVLRKNESPDAEQALDLLIASPGDDSQPPLALAAKGEALAFKERWDEASQCYQTAIDRMPVDLVRRAWWVNVATIAD